MEREPVFQPPARHEEPILEREIAVRGRPHAVEVELDVPHLHIVGHHRCHAHRLTRLDRGIEQVETRVQHDRGRHALPVRRQVIDDLEPGLAVRGIGQSVEQRDRPGHARGRQGEQELRGVGGVAQIEKVDIVSAVVSRVGAHRRHAQSRTVGHDLLEGVGSPILGGADPPHGAGI